MSDLAERIERTEQMLRAAAADAGMVVSGDGRISEADAARLLGLSPGYVKAMRQLDKGPAAYGCGVGNGTRVSYRVRALAEWIERNLFDGTADNGR